MLNSKVAEVFERDTTGVGAVGSGYTYSGHPVGAAAALACIAETKRLNVTENAAVRGMQMFKGLKKLATKHEMIGDVRGGYGLMSAVELTSDRKTKAKPVKASVDAIYQKAYENGVIIRISGPNVILSPPLIISETEVNCIITALDTAFTAVCE